MIGHVSQRKKMDNFEYQSLRKVIKEHGVDVIENFNKKFKEMKVEGKRKSVTGVLYTEYEPYFLSKTTILYLNWKLCTWVKRARL